MWALERLRDGVVNELPDSTDVTESPLVCVLKKDLSATGVVSVGES